MAGMRLETAIKYLAVERAIHFPARKEAPSVIPAGTEAEFDFVARFRGHFRKGEDGTMDAAPQVRTVLTPAVVAAMAVYLGVSQRRMRNAMERVMGQAVVKGVFDDAGVIHAGSGMLQTVEDFDRATQEKLSPKKKTGSCMVQGRADFSEVKIDVLPAGSR